MSLWDAISRGVGGLLGGAGGVAGAIGGFGGGAGSLFSGGSSLLPLITTGLSAVTALAPLLQGSSKVKQPAYVPQTINGPAGPTPDPTSFKRGINPGNVPTLLMGGLNLSSSMTPDQQISAITTQALNGNNGLARSGEAQDWVRKLANYNLIGPNGELASYEQILPTWSQYVKQVMGKEIRTNDTRGYLGALNRSA